MNDYLITKQSTTYNKYTRNYVFTDKEILRIKNQMIDGNVEYYLQQKVESENGHYVLTYDAEIDQEINMALKRDKSFYNISNNNYRIKNYDNIGQIEIFKIKNIEYLIESFETEKGHSYISIYNYEFYKKWLDYLDGLMGNYCYGFFTGIKEEIIEDASKKSIEDINDFARDIQEIFNHCLDFHNDRRFEGLNQSTKRHIVFNHLSFNIFFWKQEKEKELNISIGNLLTRLEDTFISKDLRTFIQLRDFIILWIGKVIRETINNDKKMFQWAYSPFMNDVLNLRSKIIEIFSDDRIKLKNSLSASKGNNKEPQQDSQFSVLEWATIFYYADETKLLPENRFLKSRIEKFIEFHKIPTTFKSFKSKYHTAKNRINKNNNYPIDKLELILPFLEKNYKQAVTLIDRDINFLLSEKSEYQ